MNVKALAFFFFLINGRITTRYDKGRKLVPTIFGRTVITMFRLSKMELHEIAVNDRWVEIMCTALQYHTFPTCTLTSSTSVSVILPHRTSPTVHTFPSVMCTHSNIPHRTCFFKITFFIVDVSSVKVAVVVLVLVLVVVY